MVDEQRAVGCLGTCAHVPPEDIAVGTTLLGRFVVVVRAHGAPDVDRAGQRLLRLFGEHRAEARGVLLEPLESALDELVVLGGRLVEPVDVDHIQPALLAEMIFKLLDEAGKHGLVLGRLGAEPFDLGLMSGVKRAAAHAVDGEAETGEMELLNRPGHRPIERGEIELGPGRIGLGQELHADGVHGREVVGADAVLGEALQVHVEHAALVFVGFQLVIAEDVPRRESERRVDVVLLRKREIPDVQLDRHGRRKALCLQPDLALIVVGLGVLGYVDQDPQRLVLAGRDVDRLVERRQGVGPPVADAGLVGRVIDEMVEYPQDIDVLHGNLVEAPLGRPQG